MTTSRKKLPDPSAVQRQASDPKVSAWVTASAGTGKTQVLTDRTLRLMLGGAKPDEILAITFTRAGASVMINRIRDVLNTWATCDDKTLDERLKRLTGEQPDEATKARARQLYIEFLDAHGDMRIQTMHSFAQDLLERFPLESGTPPGFEVMDDQTVSDKLRAAQADVLRQIGKDSVSPLARAVSLVTPEVNEDDFISLISELAGRRGQLKGIFKEHKGLEGTIDAVYKYLRAPKGVTAQDMYAKLVDIEDLDSYEELEMAAGDLNVGSATDKQNALVLEAWLANPDKRVEWFDDYKKIFLTLEGNVRKNLEFNDTLQSEGNRLARGIERIRTLNVAQETEALLRMAAAIIKNYEDDKDSLNKLDYDDLVYRAGQMMKGKSSMNWVLEKMPGNLKHVLIDEGQDTNPDQWDLVSSIVKALFSEKDNGNTVFVVGDEKQSIFSFQRANPEEFAAHKKEFSEQVEKSGGTWRQVEMQIAFRSSPAITQAVDAVFANPEAADGLFHDDGTGEQTVTHDPFRRGQAGIVELIPIAPKADKVETDPWPLPLTVQTVSDPAAALAEQIADRIKGWLDSGEQLESRGRPINPADIMILVRRRSAFVDHMVRALKNRDIPVAGADRISLREQIVVQDLMVLGEIVLSPTDDYKLGSALRSPLIGMSLQQVEDISIDRKGLSLWEALIKKASEPNAPKIYGETYRYIKSLQDVVGLEKMPKKAGQPQQGEELDGSRPYELFSSVMLSNCPATGKKGLPSFFQRLGYEAEDAIVEFMNALEQFEQLNTPTLRGFLSWMEAGESDVKREINMDSENPLVHIMTVHGAKGLEAPIVILPDTIGVPSDNPRARPKFLWPANDRKVPLWAPHSDLENEIYTAEREEAELERDREFRRLLYVAMTRAADRLYVYGEKQPVNKKNFEKSWYNLIRTGLTEYARDKVDFVRDPDALSNAEPTIRLNVPQTAKPVLDNVKPLDKKRVVGTPLWAKTAAPKGEGTVRRFRPSSASISAEANDNFSATSPLVDTTQSKYYANVGTAMHALLELLPELPIEEREEAAREYLAQPALAIRADDQQRTVADALTVLDHPEFGVLFGPGSRPEVSLSGYVEKDGTKQMLNALIDRLVVTEDAVLIVDYKSNRKVPKDASEVSKEYLMQLSAYKMAVQQNYPGKEVKCALLYTREAKLIILPADKVDAAIREMALNDYIPPQKKPLTARL